MEMENSRAADLIYVDDANRFGLQFAIFKIISDTYFRIINEKISFMLQFCNS